MASNAPYSYTELLGVLRDDIHRTYDEDNDRLGPDEPKLGRPDLVVISGDLAKTASTNDYNDHVRPFLEGLLKLVNLDRKRMVLVPGNHDVNCEIAAKSFRRVTKRDYDRRPKDMEPHKELIKKADDNGRCTYWRKDSATTYPNRFEPFKKCFDDFYKGAYTYSLDPENMFTVYDFSEPLGLVVVGLNSCAGIEGYFNEREKSFRPMDPRASIVKGSIHNAEQSPDFRSRQPGLIRLAVFHHNIRSVQYGENFLDPSYIEILRRYEIDLCLHGHAHKPSHDILHPEYARTLPVVGTGALAARHEDLASGVSMGYNLVVIDRLQDGIWAHSRRHDRDDPVARENYLKNGKPYFEVRSPSPGPQVIKALSLFKTSASLEMLERILLRGKLEPILDKLVQAQWVVKESKDETNRFKIALEYREALLKQCEKMKIEDPFPQYTNWWLEYARENGKQSGENYPKLKAEHDNLMGVFSQLWERANIKPIEAYQHDAMNSSSPLPPEAFGGISPSSSERQAAEDYVRLRDRIRDYLVCNLQWQDFLVTARQAYCVVLALGWMAKAAGAALDVALSYSLQDWQIPRGIEVAEEWIAAMDNAIRYVKGGDTRKLRAKAFRMRGEIEMNHHQYRESLEYFQKAIGCLEEPGRADVDVSGAKAEIYCLLAELEMKCNPKSDDDLCCEEARKYLNKALENAGKGSDDQLWAVVQAKRAVLMIWRRDWDGAQQLVRELSRREIVRQDLLAGVLYLRAFLFEHESQDKKDIDASNKQLKEAIESAKRSWGILQTIPTLRYSRQSCGTHLLLAGLYCYGPNCLEV